MPIQNIGRAEEVLEVNSLVERAANALADTLAASLPAFTREELYEYARAEFEVAAEDVAKFVFYLGSTNA